MADVNHRVGGWLDGRMGGIASRWMSRWTDDYAGRGTDVWQAGVWVGEQIDNWIMMLAEGQE